MTTHNTGNPVPSTAVKDLYDNAENFDYSMNSDAQTFQNRLGVTQYTWRAFNTMTTNALAQIGVTIANAQAAVNGAKDDAITEIQAAVSSIEQETTAAAATIAAMLSSLSDDLGNKGFATRAEMLAYVPKYTGTLAWVQADATATNNGFYQWDGTAWFKPSIQPVMSDIYNAFKKSISVKKRFRGQHTADDALIFAVDQIAALFGNQRKRFRGEGDAEGAAVMIGRTPLAPAVLRKRFRSQAFQGDERFVLVGRSIALSSAQSPSSGTTTASFDAKRVQEQNQSPSPTKFATITGGAVWVYGPLGGTQITTLGTWLAANAAAFDIVKALKTNGANPAQPHSIMTDGTVYRDGQVLIHKLVTGQSLALGSRGIVLVANGDYTIDGKRGNLFSPFTPVGYSSNLLTFPAGPRPGSIAGVTTLSPVREYVSGVLGETPATSYMLALRRWHERTSSVNPRILYSISAAGGTAYEGLKKGTVVYTAAISQVTAAKNIAAANGWDYVVPSLSIVHGESQINTTQAQYVAIQNEWLSDYDTDIRAISGQPIPIKAFISQMLTGEPGTIPAIPLAQMQVAAENPNFIMVGPKYAYGYFDQYHMTADGYIKMGELEARAERLTQVSGKWQPLKLLSYTVSGSTITLRFNNLPNGNAAVSGPIGNLSLDSALVSNPGNFGFQLSAGSIVNVQVGADGSSIVITTSTNVQSGAVLTYALQPALGSPQTNNGRRGCARDNDHRDYSRYDDKPLYNWLCAFSQALEF